MKAQIVLGTCYGDEGKGITVDNLCLAAQNRGESPIVVRHSGGQQCGHDVHYDEELSHVFGSFGSGTLRRVPTFFTEHTTMYLPRLVAEHEALMAKGIAPCLSIHGKAKVTTPFDVIFGRLLEKKQQHGSVGIGVGATMHRDTTTGYKLNVIDFHSKALFAEKLDRIHTYYALRARNELAMLAGDFDNACLDELEHFLELFDYWQDYFHIRTNYSDIALYDTAIFEGSQGILLDMDHGVFPHVTYSNTTSKNAVDVCDALGVSNVEVYYVTRCYFTRHGNGPLPEADRAGNELKLVNTHMEKNLTHEWQGEFKVRRIQPDLINQALNYDALYCGAVNKYLVVTCLDQIDEFNFEKLVSELQTKFKTVYATNSHITRGMWVVDGVGATLQTT